MASHATGDGGIPPRDATKRGLKRIMTLGGAYGTRNYTVKNLRDQKGHKVLVETLPFSVEEAVAADNDCLADARRAGVTVAMHICRGNNQSKWYAEGGYEPIAEKLFSGLDVDRFLLEYDTDRAGTFDPLRFVPKDKIVVLGLLSSKEGALEDQDELLRRIDEAAKFFPLENMALSPQCGFASMAAGNLLTEDEQWRKLEMVVDTARKVWG